MLEAETLGMPRLMFITAGWTAFAVTQSTPWTMSEYVPPPWQFTTRTATSSTSLATPYVVLPTVPATWVPWPWQSAAFESSSTVSRPYEARPPKSWWVIRIPVSST